MSINLTPHQSSETKSYNLLGETTTLILSLTVFLLVLLLFRTRTLLPASTSLLGTVFQDPESTRQCP